jgi:hypothetical protein
MWSWEQDSVRNKVAVNLIKTARKELDEILSYQPYDIVRENLLDDEFMHAINLHNAAVHDNLHTTLKKF